METLTYFINDLYENLEENLGETVYQTFENKNIISVTYKDETISGSLIQDVVFEEVIFDNCTFFASEIKNCIFINCLFLNCTLQFSKFSECNFEGTLWENCKWGLSTVKATDIKEHDSIAGISFESTGIKTQTVLNLSEFLSLTA